MSQETHITHRPYAFPLWYCRCRDESQMSVDGRGQTHHGALGAVRVHRVLHRHVNVVIDVLQRHAVLPHRLLLHRVVRPEAAALAVRHP